MPTEVTLSADAYRVVCGLVQPSDVVDSELVMAEDATWAELREAFPAAAYYMLAEQADADLEAHETAEPGGYSAAARDQLGVG